MDAKLHVGEGTTAQSAELSAHAAGDANATEGGDGVGTIVGGHYRLNREHAWEHPSCALFGAEDLRSGQPRTIKLARAGSRALPALGNLLLHEAQQMALLSHPCIAQVLEFNCDDQGRYFLVMEPVMGCTLGRILAEQGVLSLAQTLRILKPLASALQHAHDMGVTHGALRADCVFVKSAPGAPVDQVTLLGFEQARNVNLSQPSGVLSSAVDALGLDRAGVEYCAPECRAQAGGEGRSGRGPASDQYALGVLSYRMLAGRFPAADVAAVGDAAGTTRGRRDGQGLDALLPQLPAHVAQAIEKAMAPDKSDRHASVLDMMRWLEGRPPYGAAGGPTMNPEATVRAFRPDLIALCAGADLAAAVGPPSGRDLPGPDLSGPDLSGPDLPGPAAPPLRAAEIAGPTSDPVVSESAPEITQEELLPLGAVIGKRRQQRQRAWIGVAAVGACVGLGLGLLALPPRALSGPQGPAQAVVPPGSPENRRAAAMTADDPPQTSQSLPGRGQAPRGTTGDGVQPPAPSGSPGEPPGSPAEPTMSPVGESPVRAPAGPRLSLRWPERRPVPPVWLPIGMPVATTDPADPRLPPKLAGWLTPAQPLSSVEGDGPTRPALGNGVVWDD